MVFEVVKTKPHSIRGMGSDMIGEFTLEGVIQDGKCEFTK